MCEENKKEKELEEKLQLKDQCWKAVEVHDTTD